MPKKVSQKDRVAIDNIGISLERQSNIDNNAIQDLARAALTPVEIFYSFEQQLGGGVFWGFSDIRKRLLLIKTKARSQTYDVVWYLSEYLRHQPGMSDSQRLVVVRWNRHLGRQFGNLTDEFSEKTCQELPEKYFDSFTYDPKIERADFSQDLKTAFKNQYTSDRGCPVMRETAGSGAVGPAKEINLYNVYWDLFATDCIAEHILGNKPYETPPVVQGTD